MTFTKQKERNISDGTMSNPYRSHTHKSFKKLTEIEKQQIEFLSKIHKLKHKARILGDLRFITNEVLSNCAYHEKNIEDQTKRLERLNVPNEEKEIILEAWNLKLEVGKSLMNGLKELINYVKSCNNG